MRILLTAYLVLTALHCYHIGTICLTKRHAPGAAVVGLSMAVLGGSLALAVILEVI